MKSTEFTGRTTKMKESPWLSSEDLEGLGDVEMVIEGVFYNEDVALENGVTGNKYSLKFSGATKQMMINSINRKTIEAIYGRTAKDWKGRKVTLYVDPRCKNPKGKGYVNGIRVRRPESSAVKDATKNLEK